MPRVIATTSALHPQERVFSSTELPLSCHRCPGRWLLSTLRKFIRSRSGKPNNSAMKQRGRENKGPLDIAPKILLPKQAKMVSVPSTGVIGKSAHRNRPVSERNFWMISGTAEQLKADLRVGSRKWGNFCEFGVFLGENKLGGIGRLKLATGQKVKKESLGEVSEGVSAGPGRPFNKSQKWVSGVKNRESLNVGLANGGLRYLSTIAYDCRHFVKKVPLGKGPKKVTKVHNCGRLCANCREWP